MALSPTSGSSAPTRRLRCDEQGVFLKRLLMPCPMIPFDGCGRLIVTEQLRSGARCLCLVKAAGGIRAHDEVPSSPNRTRMSSLGRQDSYPNPTRQGDAGPGCRRDVELAPR